MTSRYDVLVVGGGQAGLASAYALGRAGLSFVILEASDQFGGAWRHFYRSLELFSPAHLSELPGSPFPGDPRRFPTASEVHDYLSAYASALDPPVVFGAAVDRVERVDERFLVHTKAGESYESGALIAATGIFGHPFAPSFAGQDELESPILHTADYTIPEPFEGQRVLVVGSGASAVQVACDLEPHAETVTLTSRKPIKYLPLTIAGKSTIAWSRITGTDFLPLREQVVVLDSGKFRAAFRDGRIVRRKMFERLTRNGVVWPGGEQEEYDAIVLGTGFRPHLDYLRDLPLRLDARGEPKHRRGASKTVPGLYFLGLQAQRTLASPTLRGVGPDAAHVVRKIRKYLATRATAGR